jgi:hypothetical protein
MVSYVASLLPTSLLMQLFYSIFPLAFLPDLSDERLPTNKQAVTKAKTGETPTLATEAARPGSVAPEAIGF